MPEIILTDDQARLVSEALGPVMVRDTKGAVVGHIEPKLTAEMIAELKHQAATGPWYTGSQVQDRLQALQQEWDRTGGFDAAYMHQFLERLDAADPARMDREGGDG